MFSKPLPIDPLKEQMTDRELVDMRIQAYFYTLGWDELGISTKETLDRLGLSGVDLLMEKLLYFFSHH